MFRGSPVSAETPEQTGTRQLRTARAVINEAIRENSQWDTMCWWLVIAFACTGVLTVLVGLILNNGLVTLSGSVAGALFWPALYYAVTIRRANIALRLLELALNNARTVDEALQAINQAFSFHFGQGEDVASAVPQTETHGSLSRSADS
jgi:hypothetical protein